MSLGNVIDMALSQVGTTEYPPNSNKVKYNTEYYGSPVSGPAYPWCITFLWWCFSHGGESSAFYGGGKTASSTALMTYYQNQGRFVTSGYQLGDIVFYNFDGGSGADHAEIIVGIGNGKYTTIGGNTTPGEEGSQNNGGCVARKTRYPSQFLGAGRPAYAGSGGGGGSTPSSLRAKIIRATATVLAMHSIVATDVAKTYQKKDEFKFTIRYGNGSSLLSPAFQLIGTVNWGDGTVDTYDSFERPKHNYYIENGSWSDPVQVSYYGEFKDVRGSWGGQPELFNAHDNSTIVTSLNIVSIDTKFPKSFFENALMSGDFHNLFQGSGTSPISRLVSVPQDLFAECEYVDPSRYSGFYGCFSGRARITSAVPELWLRFPDVDGRSCFRGCTKAANYSSIPSGWR